MGIIQRIRSKYGRTGEVLLRRFQKAATNLAKDNNKMKFLLNCRRCKVIPKCLNYRIHVQIKSRRSKEELEKLLFRQKIRILSVMIADVKRSIAELQKNKTRLLNKIETAFEQDDVITVRKMGENKSRYVHTTTKKRGERKIETLKNKRIAEMNTEEEWVENTTETQLPDFLQRTLSLGPNFNVQDKGAVPYV